MAQLVKHSNQITAWKAKLKSGAPDVFVAGGGHAAAQPALDVKSLHAKLGHLMLDNDLLGGALTRAGSRIALAVVAAAIVLGFKSAEADLLWSVEPSAEFQNINTSHATITRIKQSSAGERYALRVDFQPAQRPQVEFSLAAFKADWRPFNAIALEVSNPLNEPIEFAVEVEDATGTVTSGRTQSDLGPHKAASYALPINSPWPAEMGMRGEPLIPRFHLMAEDHHPVDIKRLTKLRIVLVNPKGPRSLIIDNIRVIPGVTYDKIVDEFGQFALDDWPGKITSATQLETERNQEEVQLNERANFPDRDKWGGWVTGPQFEASGYFRVMHRDRKWWLVTPSGHLFFSLGMNAISIGQGATVVERRERMFRWLPAPEDPLAAHYGVKLQEAPIGLQIKLVQGRTFTFYTANLERKYGRDWLERWRTTTLARLRAWGFNTVGNWSDPELYENGEIPYTATLEVSGPVADVPSGGDYWRRMLDPFDPSFAKAVEQSVQRDTRCPNNPWCIGYFVDNELSWGSRYGLAFGALSLDASSPAKRAFVDQLQKQYASISEFNRAWNSNFFDWRQLLENSFRPDMELTEGMREDMRTFVQTLARRYFQTVRDALKKYDPKHLYLGSRFAGYTPESVAACAEFCDVLSFNIYQPSVDPAEWRFLNDLGKPVIIGEFHMGATDRGMFHPGLVSTPDQAARAAGFITYVRSVLDNPVFVGCHYFEYTDEPLTGRALDGENYSIGFTTVVDSPYPEMVEAAKAVGAEMYLRKSR